MLYILAISLTIPLTWFILKISNKNKIKGIRRVIHRQSSLHSLTKSFIQKEKFDDSESISQSRKHIQKNMLKVIMLEGKAYWVVDNVFYVANTVDGRIDAESVEPVDIINMPKEELNKMLKILDSLKIGSGNNDSGSSGN